MGWLPPSADGIAMCQGRGVERPASGEGGEMKDTMIGVDLAKRVFQLFRAAMTGEVKFRKKLTRERFRVFMAGQPAALVVFEACGSAMPLGSGAGSDRSRSPADRATVCAPVRQAPE